MLLATFLAAPTASLPVERRERPPPPSPRTQLITVEAATTRTTYASLRTWRRAGGCWVAAGGPYPARLGWNGLSADRREGDGTTPAGTFRIHATMYGNEANPGVRFRYRRARCGDWWDEDPSSPTYNSFQHVPCGAAALRGQQRRHLAEPARLPLPRGDRVQHAAGRAGARLRDLPARGHRARDERLRQPPPPRRSAVCCAGCDRLPPRTSRSARARSCAADGEDAAACGRPVGTGS